jgi:hypothetical protein
LVTLSFVGDDARRTDGIVGHASPRAHQWRPIAAPRTSRHPERGSRFFSNSPGHFRALGGVDPSPEGEKKKTAMA